MAMMLGHVKIVNPCYFIATRGNDEGTPVGVSKLNFLLIKLYFDYKLYVEMYL